MTVRDISVAFGFNVDKSSQKEAENSIQGIKSMATKVLGGIAVVLSIAKLNAFKDDCVAAASQVEEMENKFDVVFGDMADQVDEWATKFADSVGRNKNTIKTYLADQQNLLVGFGMTREEGAKLSEEMTTLALDIASFSNQDEDVAVNAMTKAVMGQSEAAKTLGAVLNETTRAETMQAMGLQGTYEKLSQLEKMQVNYNTILRQSPDAIGDCVRSMGSYESSQRQLKAAQQEFKEFIGGQLLPVMAIFTQWITKGVKVATKFAKAILLDAEGNNRILKSFEKVNAVVKRLQPSIERFANAMKTGISKGIDVAKNIIDRFGGMENALKLLGIVAGAFFIAMNWSKIIGGAKTFMGFVHGIGKMFSLSSLKVLGLVAVIVVLALIVEDLINFMMGNDSVIGSLFEKAGIDADAAREAIFNAFNAVKDFLSNTWEFIKNTAGAFIDAVVTFFDEHGQQIIDAFVNAWDFVSNLLSGVWSFIKEMASTLFGDTESEVSESQTGIMDKIMEVWNSIVAFIGPIFQSILEAGSAIFGALKIAISTIFNGLKAFWNNWGGTILGWFSNLWKNLGQFILGFLTVVKGVANFIKSVLTGDWSGAWNSIKDIFAGAWQMITALLRHIWGTLTMILTIGLGVLQSIWGNIWQAISDFFQGIWNGILSFISGIWDGITGAITGAINSIQTVIQTVLEAIFAYFSTIFTNISTFVSTTFTNILSGVTGTVGNIKDSIVNGFTAAVDFIKGLPGQALTWGSDMIDGIVKGITGSIGKVQEAVKGVADKIKSFLHFSVPDEGPLTDYESWMPDFIGGLASGISKNKKKVIGEIKELTSGMNALMQGATASMATATNSQVNNATSNMTQNVNINNSYSGGSMETQRNISTAMRKSAVDATTQMARGLAYARG